MPRVLVIEDDADFRDVLRRSLEAEGFEVAAAPDGAQALQMQRERPASVVVSDIFMPEKEGVETILELRKHYPQTKIVAISGGGESVRGDYLPVVHELGVCRAFRKPFDLDDLIHTVRELTGP